MTVTTRGRYALRVLCDIAENQAACGQDPRSYVSLKDISERQDISRKYLEGIMNSLCKAGLLESSKGKSGGYRLTRPAEKISVGEILRVTEGDLAPVSCMGDGAPPCERAAECPTLPVWEKLNIIINDYLDSVSLADL
ncbi:MAG: RrF2 family transcriptional regulator [Firmicutes bacterium]|nr:RrF2 family transcriptional regulator [Bacillota bacterium]MBQ2058469.1 RrF2 family transcriptional regulator [Bacillota bacterium]MBQ4372127.1 RrF2 family transcriptional regulator [Bacillota bacterium]